MARIAIDCRSMHRSQGGIGRYADELTRALAQFDSPHRFEILHGASLPERFDQTDPDPDRVVRHGFATGMIDPVWEQLHLPTELARLEVDLYHATCFVLPVARGNVRSVATIHDVVFRVHPEWVEPWLREYLDRWTEVSLELADRIVTVSSWSRDEIVRIYRTDPARITVIHNGVSARFSPAPAAEIERMRTKYSLPERFFLYLGAIEPKKNIDLLLDACRWRLDRSGASRPCPLVLAGATGGQRYDLDGAISVRRLGEHVRRLGYIADEDVPAVLSAARVFVYPSLYEGFGLPILEAMACGTPVIAARASATPEIVGEAALLVDPTDPMDLAASIDRMLEDDELRRGCRERGLARATELSWDRCARQHLALYDELLAAQPAKAGA